MNVDLTFLEQFANGDKAKMAKYISIFLRSAPAMLNTIEAKFAENDLPGLRTAAHSLKPQITYMGIREMETVVKRIEHIAGENSNIEQLPTLVAELKVGVEDAFLLLQAELTKLSA
jgi:HPt (histidine-containing phosphotransfer) domain-containing protein